MLKAIFKSAPLPLLILSTLLSSCADPEAQQAKKLEQADTLIASGDFPTADRLLNELAQADPENTEILRKRISLYRAQEDVDAVAFLMQEAQRRDPKDIELLYQTYLAQEAAGVPSATYLEQFAELAPDAMTPELWEKLGQSRAAANQPQAALNAYLKASTFDGYQTSPESAAAIGELFLKVDNAAQAERWFKIAAESDDPHALRALFGLLEINLRNKNWPEAEIIIQQLEAQFPGAIAASQWADAPEQLATWREAQEKMRAALEKEKAEAEAAAQNAQANQAPLTTDELNELSPTPSDKSEVVAELAAVEALADVPAVEADEPVEVDGALNLESADTELSFKDTTTGDAVIDDTVAPDAAPMAPPMTTDELLAEAAALEQQRDYKAAIQYYWRALGQSNDRTDIWNQLSSAYLIDGQLQNAETAVLESLRLDPSQVNTMLDYLRIAQRTKTPRDFLAEIETAGDRFPQNPEIALSLARAYERIARNNAAARSAYSRFIQLAPSHPLRPEAESALARLR